MRCRRAVRNIGVDAGRTERVGLKGRQRANEEAVTGAAVGDVVGVVEVPATHGTEGEFVDGELIVYV